MWIILLHICRFFLGFTVDLLPSHKKQTVHEIRKTLKNKEQILKENLEKLNLIKSASTVALDKDTINLVR